MRNGKRFTIATMTAALALAAGVIGVGPAHAGSSSKGKLNTTSSSPDPAKTKGKVEFKSRGGADGKFQIVANKLAPNTSYDVVVNGIRVASVVTNKGGTGKIQFSTRPRAGKQALLGFDPRGASVSLRDADGDDVLEGSVPHPVVKTGDLGKVGCCVPDDGGSECEDRTPERCTAEGGTPTATGSCLPDPCGGIGDVNGDGEDDDDEAEVLCCIPGADASTNDDPEVECEDVKTSVECASSGGVLLAATSCDGNPCSPTPPSEVSACCVPDDDDSGEVDCEIRTPDRCTNRGGTPVPGVTVCAVDTCPGGSGED